MLLNLRSVVAQVSCGGRSVLSRRNFSSGVVSKVAGNTAVVGAFFRVVPFAVGYYIAELYMGDLRKEFEERDMLLMQQLKQQLKQKESQ